MTAQELITQYAAGRRDFSGANLAGAYLSGAYLSGAYLSGANFSGAQITVEQAQKLASLLEIVVADGDTGEA